MPSADQVASDKREKSVLGILWAFPLNTVIVYVLALHISPVLVSRWFAWIAPLLQTSPTASPADWYLQHLEWVTIVPALAAGYINVARFIPTLVGRPSKESLATSAALWAWTIPALVLAYGMLNYDAPRSVLFATSKSAIDYFFDIQTTMPNRSNFLTIDTRRVLIQRTVTAPFYAGLAYSLGALLAKYRLLAKFFGRDQSEDGLSDEESGETTPAPPSFSQD